MLGSADLVFPLDKTGEQVLSKLVQLDEGTLRVDGGLLISLPGFRLPPTGLPFGKYEFLFAPRSQ
jgi:hypothetical protein